jgi:hypothetical protein
MKNAEQWCFIIGEMDGKLLTIGVSATGKSCCEWCCSRGRGRKKSETSAGRSCFGSENDGGMGCFCDWEEVKSAEQRCFGVGETVTSVFQRCFGIREMNSAAPRSFSIREMNSAAQRSFSIMKNHQCCKTVFQHHESFVLFEESVFPVL